MDSCRHAERRVQWQPDVYFSINSVAAIATLQAEGVDASSLEISNEIYSTGYSQLLPTDCSVVSSRAQIRPIRL